MTDFKTTRVVTRPVLKLEKEKPLYFRAIGEIFVGQPAAARPGSTRKPAAPLQMNVVRLPDGLDATLTVHSTLRAQFDAAYPEKSYVGKAFSVTAKNREPGRQYQPFYLSEIEDPDKPAAPAGESSSGAAPAPSAAPAAAASKRK